MPRRQKMIPNGLSIPKKHRFFDYTQVVFLDSQKSGFECSVPFDHLKCRFYDLAKVAFWICQKEDNPSQGVSKVRNIAL
jgi:hypothetical protein